MYSLFYTYCNSFIFMKFVFDIKNAKLNAQIKNGKT